MSNKVSIPVALPTRVPSGANAIEPVSPCPEKLPTNVADPSEVSIVNNLASGTSVFANSRPNSVPHESKAAPENRTEPPPASDIVTPGRLATPVVWSIVTSGLPTPYSVSVTASYAIAARLNCGPGDTGVASPVEASTVTSSRLGSAVNPPEPHGSPGTSRQELLFHTQMVPSDWRTVIATGVAKRFGRTLGLGSRRGSSHPMNVDPPRSGSISQRLSVLASTP